MYGALTRGILFAVACVIPEFVWPNGCSDGSCVGGVGVAWEWCDVVGLCVGFDHCYSHACGEYGSS